MTPRDDRAGRLRHALYGKDKDGGDRAPAIGERDAGLDRREQIALMRENARDFFSKGTDAATVIRSRVEGDPQSPGRDEYLKRH